MIEVMVSVCIIGLLAAIATPFYLSYLEKARVAVAISDLTTYRGGGLQPCFHDR